MRRRSSLLSFLNCDDKGWLSKEKGKVSTVVCGPQGNIKLRFGVFSMPTRTSGDISVMSKPRSSPSKTVGNPHYFITQSGDCLRFVHVVCGQLPDVQSLRYTRWIRSALCCLSWRPLEASAICLPLVLDSIRRTMTSRATSLPSSMT